MKVIPVALVATAAALLLTSCIYVVQPDRDDDVTTGPGPVATTDCGDAPVEITEDGVSPFYSGACPRVTIAANDVTLTIGTVDDLVITGDRVTVFSDDLGSLSIGGNENEIDGDDIGSVTINGDRNLVGGDDIGSVTIGGNDNSVTGDSVGASTVTGDRNTVGAD